MLKDVASYGPWRAKLTSILVAEDCWEIVSGTEIKPFRIAVMNDANNAPLDQPAIDARQAKIKDFRKCSKKADSLITHTLDDSIVMSLDVHARNPVDMWNQLAADYKTVTLAQRSATRKEFLNFTISEEESHLDIKQRYNELLRKVTLQGGAMDITDRLETLLNALPQK